MKQEWILNDEEKQVRRKKIEEKRSKKRKNSVQSSSSETKSTSDSSNTGNPSPGALATDLNSIEVYDQNNDISDDEIIHNITDIESYIFSDDVVVHKDDDDDDDNDDIAPDVYQKAVELEFAVLPIARPMGENSNTFNELEYNRLTELFTALNIMQTQLPENSVEMKSMDEMCNIMATKVDKEIRALVTVSKNLSAFNTMCENDQISLLKYGSLEIFSMRSVLTYDFINDSWTLVMDNNQSILLRFSNLEYDYVFAAHKNYLRKIGKEWDSDPYILDLLTAIVLFNPDRPNLIHKDMVKLQQQMYMYLLQRYLLLKSKSECHSKEKFLRLLNTLHDLEEFNKLKMTKCAQSRNAPEAFGPLLREILDINN
ncbi:unnamed protein product [Oppiella nova]|uniref:NR LBD domain-containing protein n=1 Tax=Oppiella nova TaxID=334625 RepID=A0A7R9LYY6_9ACAR|nr:unnamed protein product [Oppiella nova]CAG2167705.1 unnamed protein product [Oppiella nova]